MNLTRQPDGAIPAGRDEPVGLYIHAPFCSHICPYCDFNTYSGQESRIDAYVEAVIAEIALRAATHDDRPAATLFFGGGTPSLLGADQIGRIVAAARAGFALDPAAEITLEANPNGLTVDYLTALRETGVNRLSIGGQTFSHRGLRVLGRLHNAIDTTRALDAATAAGFDNLSLDLIYGWPGQTLESWANDLDQVINPAPPGGLLSHLSLYGLIVEPGTPMAAAVERGIMTLPADDLAADMYELAMAKLGDAGWFHYEVANWARTPNHMSRHNRLYWRNSDFYGIGAGAHGTVNGERWLNLQAPAAYIKALGENRLPTSNTETIDARTAMGETMMLGLRLRQEGVSKTAFARRHGVPIESVFGEQLAMLGEIGMLTIDGDTVRLTDRGFMLANDVCARFL